jgi:hypothetical protein
MFFIKIKLNIIWSAKKCTGTCFLGSDSHSTALLEFLTWISILFQAELQLQSISIMTLVIVVIDNLFMHLVVLVVARMLLPGHLIISVDSAGFYFPYCVQGVWGVQSRM